MRRVVFFCGCVAIGVAALAAETRKPQAAAGKPSGAKASADAKRVPGRDEKSAGLDLNGVWRGWVVEGKGENPNRGATHLELTINGNQIVGKKLDGEGSPLGQGTYTIKTENLYLMDATETGKRGKPKVYLGIVRFGPDLMRWCVSTPGNKRPAEFETKGNQFLMILKRQKQ